METNDVIQKLEAHEKKLDAIFRSTEKTRRYIFWTMIGSIVVFVLPLIGLLFVVPYFLSVYSSMYQGLGL